MVYPVTERYCLILGVCLIALLALAAPVAADEHVISPGAGAIQAGVDAASDGDIIILNPGTYTEHEITITGKSLTFRADTVNGHGQADTIIDAQEAGRIFYVMDTSSLTIDNLTLKNGKAATYEPGGAIFGTTVTVTSSTFSGCSAGDDSGPSGMGGFGGAIFGTTVTVTSSTFSGCSAGGARGPAGTGGYGGAIAGSTVTVTSSTFSGCSTGNGETSGDGGAIMGNTVTVTSSTFSGCSAGTGLSGGHGGAIEAGHLTVTSSTFSGCSAGSSGTGSAVLRSADGSISFCRFVDNVGTALSSPVTASNNWWGSNTGTRAPWLVLGVTASPGSISTTQTATVRANLTFNSAGSDTSGSGTIPDWNRVTFTATGGTVSPEYAVIKNGIATTTFTPSGTGTAYITATVDHESVTVPVTVTAGSGSATALAVDPVTASTVYAGVDGSGIYTTTDGGTSWTGATTQPANRQVRALVISPLDRTRLFAGTYGGGVNRSVNSGADWGPCGNAGLANLNVLDLVSDHNGRLYAGTEQGVYTSTDCDSWTAVNNGLP